MSGLLPTPRAYEGGAFRDEDGNKKPSGLKAVIENNMESTSSQAASHVSLFPQQEREMEDQITAISGRKCLELYKNSNQRGLSLRMFAEYLVLKTGWYSSKCALIWKMQDTKYSRLLFLLSPSMRTTDETESGLLPTPNTMEGIKPKPLENIVKANKKNRPGRSKLTMNLRELIHYGDRDLEGNSTIETQVKLWPTPQAIDGSGKGRKPRLKKDCNRDPDKPGSWRGDLKDIVLLPTPTGQDAENDGGDSQYDRNSLPLNAIVKEKGASGSLNPQFVEWLMGFPQGWTDIEDESQQESPTESTDLKHLETQ